MRVLKLLADDAMSGLAAFAIPLLSAALIWFIAMRWPANLLAREDGTAAETESTLNWRMKRPIRS